MPAPAAAAILIGAALATLPGLEPQAARGFDHFFNLEFEQAIVVFRKAIQDRPQAAHLRNHLAQAILYRELLRAGALETELVTGGNAFLRRAPMNPSPRDEADFDEAVAGAMRLSQAALDKSPADVAALYTMGVAFGLRGNYSFLVRKSWISALR